MPSALKQFLPFLDEKFPRLSRRYREWYLGRGYAPEKYRREISARIELLRKKYGLAARPAEPEPSDGAARQLILGLDAATPAGK